MICARMTTAAAIGASLAAMVGAASAQQISRAELPDNPKPGECYEQVYVPAPTREVAKRVRVQDRSTNIVVVPAQYEWRDEEFVIETEREEIEVIPARFEMQKRKVVIEPEREEIEVRPAVYETVREPVVVRKAYNTWRRCAPEARVNAQSAETMCYVTAPAEYAMVDRRVVVREAETISRTIPERSIEIDVRVMVERPRRRVRRIPEVTRTIRVLRQVSELRTDRISVPASYETVYETVKNGRGRLEWRPILCEGGIDRSMIVDVQRALRSRGFNPGPIDGVIGRRTRAAILAFQRAQNLEQGGLQQETLFALGIQNPG